MMSEKKDDIKMLFRDNIVVLFLVLIIVILSIASPYIRNLGNLMDVAKQASINGIIALGMTYVITTEGSTFGRGGLGAERRRRRPSDERRVAWPLACAAGIAVGILCGLSTGLW
jgi:ribose/xylose/arabinose/galactoside ABC-type transport system permease subunit